MKEHNTVTLPISRALLKDWSLTATVAGLIGVLVSYAGPFAVVLQATRAAHLDAAHTASWVWAVALGSGVSGVLLSLLTRMPVIVAWSTPGAALLVSSLGGHSFSDAVGAFLLASLGAAFLGYTGWFGRLLALVPRSLMSALLAGVLLPFVVSGSAAVATAPLVAGSVVASFIVAKRFVDRYAVVVALTAGALAAAASGVPVPRLRLELTSPVWTWPTFDPQAVLSIGFPLLLITLAAQNAPGLTVLHQDGFDADDRLLVGSVSLVSALLTPFGGHATNLAAITAAICTGPASHAERARRYVAGLVCGAGNLIAAALASSLVSAYSALPASMIAAVAAVALLPSVIGALSATLSGPPPQQTAALMTMAVTASGIVVAGVGSAFWGLIVGVAVWLVLPAALRLDAPSHGQERPAVAAE